MRIPAHVVMRTFAAETVLLNLKTSQYHGLDEIGRRMLDLLCETGDVDETARRMAEEYDEPVRRIGPDVVDLCAALLERGLLVEDHGPAGA
jgi:hypothetical protein